MRRVAAWLVSLAVALLGWLPVSAPDAVAVTKPLTIHTYDSPMYGTPSDYTEFARGPPTNNDYTAHVKAVDHASHGASARMSATTTAPSYHYDGSVPLAPVDNTTGTTATSGAAIGAEFSALHRSEVAANSVPASEIRFSQRSVNGAAEIEASMRANGWVGDAIDVVRMPDGALTSLDNTRLLAANRAGIDVQANVHAFDALIPESMAGRFLSRSGAAPTTWGEAISNRIAGQGAMYRNRYPSGSPFTGWSGN